MFIVILLFALCSLGASQSNVGLSISSFALDFYKECSATPGDIVLSPFSVATLLTILSQGANGTTYEQLQRQLYPNATKAIAADQYHDIINGIEKSSNDATFSMINSIFIRDGHEINPSFSEVVKTKFSSTVESLDFKNADASAKKINDLVKTHTHGKILDIVKSSDFTDDTELYLVNAIYFKANWEQKFDKNLTKKGDFHANENQIVPVDYMHLKGKFLYGDWDAKQAQILEMKYVNSPYSFVIILPDKGMNLPTLQNRFTSYELNNYLHNDLEEADVDVQIPKFSIEYEIDLESIFGKLHLDEMFKYKKDLSGLLNTGRDLRVSKAIHKAVIEVNEDGSEAAGATSIDIEYRSLAPRQQVQFIADRPFMYLIRDNEKQIILFNGRVENFKSQPAYLKASASQLTVSGVILVPILLIWAINSKISSLMTRIEL